MNKLELRLRRIGDDFYLDPPTTIHFNLTYRCNRDCLYCTIRWMVGQVYGSYENARRQEMGIDTIKRILDEAREIGVRLFKISGGEPFIRDDVYEIIRYGIALGLNIFPLTRYTITIEETKRLCDTGLKNIGISFDSFSDYTNRRLHGSSVFKNELLKSINYLLDAGIEPIILPVIGRFNYLQYEGLVKRFKGLGIKYISPMVVCEVPVVIKKGFKVIDRSLLLSDKTAERARGEIDRINYVYKIKDMPWVIPQGIKDVCPAGSVACITPDGCLVYCVRTFDLYIGSVKRCGLMRVWQAERRRELMRPPRARYRETRCFRCKRFDVCNKVGRCYYSTMGGRSIYLPEEERLCKRFLT